MKLCLGTVQFGLDYGINNKQGKIQNQDVDNILNFASDNGIFLLDTASAYGDSETVLGDSISKINKNFQIITKYPINTDIKPFQYIDNSLKNLKVEKIYGYLFHNYSIFEEHPDYIDDFVKIKQSGKCEKIGFSLYYPSEAEYIIKNNISCDIVQIPYNIFDQRFRYLFCELVNKGIDIYVRSIFLQGLFFIKPEILDVHFVSIKNHMIELQKIANDNSLSIAALCMGFVNSNEYIKHIVIGVDSLENLRENIEIYNTLENNFTYNMLEKYSINDENIILPFNWKK